MYRIALVTRLTSSRRSPRIIRPNGRGCVFSSQADASLGRERAEQVSTSGMTVKVHPGRSTTWNGAGVIPAHHRSTWRSGRRRPARPLSALPLHRLRRPGVDGGAAGWPGPAADAAGICAEVIEPDGCLVRVSSGGASPLAGAGRSHCNQPATGPKLPCAARGVATVRTLMAVLAAVPAGGPPLTLTQTKGNR
jgi:hypothetical protein